VKFDTSTRLPSKPYLSRNPNDLKTFSVFSLSPQVMKYITITQNLYWRMDMGVERSIGIRTTDIGIRTDAWHLTWRRPGYHSTM